jgi:hypothetical protein
MSVNTPVGSWLPTNNTTQSGTAYLNNIDADVDVLSRVGAMFVPQALPTPAMMAQVYQGHVYNVAAPAIAVTASTTSGSTSLGSLSTVAGLTIGMTVTGTGIPANATLAGLNASGTATLSAAATATSAGDVLTVTPSSTLIEVGAVTTGSTTSGSTSLGSLGTTQGIAIGMAATIYSYVGGVFTLAAPSGSIVTAVTTSSVTLNNAATLTVAGAQCCFAQPIGTTVTGTVTSGSTSLGSLTTTSGMFAGMSVAAAGVPATATIAGITGPNTATLSAAATATHAGATIAVTVPVPASNSRLDRVTLNRLSGQANWIAGTPAAAPVPPAIPLGQVPIAQLFATTSSTALANTSSIWDERDFTALGTAPGAFGTQISLASAATCDLGAAGSNNILVTGTTAITALGSSASVSAPLYQVEFAGALTLTYNSTSLILPGGVSIATAAGDAMLALYQGSGNWRVLDYMTADGSPVSVTGAEVTLASAATVNLGAAGSNLIAISGTTTITSFGSSASTANPLYWVRFTGALTLTYNATSLILPGSATITTAAGDAMLAQYLGSGNWKVHYYQPETGKALISPTQPNLQISIFTSSGTFTTSVGSATTTRYKFTATGGGGGGGNSSGSSTAGTGGGAGGTVVYEASGIAAGTNLTVTVGAGGTAGASGGTSSAVVNGVTITASGGSAGTTSTSANGGAGGTAANGTININGGDGTAVTGSGVGAIAGGDGGCSFWGGGGAGSNQSGSTGNSGKAYGSGGGGAGGNGSQGGAGAGGIVMVEWIL